MLLLVLRNLLTNYWVMNHFESQVINKIGRAINGAPRTMTIKNNTDDLSQCLA